MKLPGIGLPISQVSPLPTEGIRGDWRAIALPVTVRERVIIALTASLKDEPDWEHKVFDEDVVQKWRSEALAGERAIQTDPEFDEIYDFGDFDEIEYDYLPLRQRVVTETLFQYCIDELRSQAADSRANGFTAVLETNAAVYIADKAVNLDTKTTLQSGVARLEASVPDKLKDWRVDYKSNHQVLNVVDPCLFPLMYGTSKYLREGAVPLDNCPECSGSGETVPVPSDSDQDERSEYSEKYQLLPCNVSVSTNGDARITSYINNLHPEGNEDLYFAIEQVITKAIPLWKLAVRSTVYRFQKPRVSIQGDGYDHVAASSLGEQRNGQSSTRDSDSNDDGHHDDNERQNTNPPQVQVPEPDDFVSRKRQSTRKAASTFDRTFAGRNLQVIVKLSSIHLTPEWPTYDGGSWRLEGLPNEHICASAYYYYDSINVTDSHLSFYELVDDACFRANDLNWDDKYFRSDEEADTKYRYNALAQTYGFTWKGAIVHQQVVGRVLTREDRLVVFPNVVQRRACPFGLADPTQAGHRKVLALFLVDPNIPIPSTANIPPQQRDWWVRQIDQNGALSKLPKELSDMVLEEARDFPMSTEQAKYLRARMIPEMISQRKELERGWMPSYSW